MITTSEATRADLAELAGVDPERVFVIPLAADPRIFHPCNDAYASRIEHLRKRLGIDDAPYLLALNAHELRKNMDAAILAFTRAVAEGGARDLTLVIAGPASAEPGIQSALAEAAQRQSAGDSRGLSCRMKISRRSTAARSRSCIPRSAKASGFLRWKRCSVAHR